MTDLLLVRHGQATHNLEGLLEGGGAAPLTSEGQQEAEAVGQRLAACRQAITRLYSSPVLRAWQTAEYIGRALALSPVAHDGLREINFGEANGQTLESFRETMPEAYAHWQDRSDFSFQWPGGEQRLGFYQRVSQAFSEIIARHPGEQIVVVAHGGSLRAGLAYLLPDTMSDWWGYDLVTASLTHVRVGDAGNSLMALNDCQHLSEEVQHERPDPKS